MKDDDLLQERLIAKSDDSRSKHSSSSDSHRPILQE